MLLAAAGYVVIAGVVAWVNFAGLELRQSPAGGLVLLTLGTLAILAAGVLAVGGAARDDSTGRTTVTPRS